jgi:spermidine synthase
LQRGLAYLFFLLSGATGLVYELTWTRELIFVFGGTTYAITTVLVAFMGGLGLGCYIAGRYAARITAAGRAYGILEILIGLYALAAPLLLAQAEPLYRALYPLVSDSPGALTAVRFLVGALVLVIPTTMMGATLPILVRHVAGAGRAEVGLLYGVNTLGAFCGTVLAGFVLLPALGLTVTTRVAAAANLIIGVLAATLLRPVAPLAAVEMARIEAGGGDAGLRRAVLISFALSGFAAMVYQIAWTRALVQALGSSTYSFTCILAAFILGLAVGSLIASGISERVARPAVVAGWVQIAVGVSAVLLAPLYGFVPLWAHWLVTNYVGNYEFLVTMQFVTALAITLLPTLLLGAMFPLVVRATDGGDRSAAAGRAYAVNTLGTILGSLLAGFVLIRSQVLGAQMSINAAALLNAAAGAWLVVRGRPADQPVLRQALPALAGTIVVAAAASLAGAWDPMYMAAGPFRVGVDPVAAKAAQELVYVADGPDLTVAVTRVRNDADTLSMTVNGKADASTGIGDMCTQTLLGHLPLLATPGAKSVCVIGLGSGMTLAAAARDPRLERLDCVEISEEVIVAAEFFRDFTYDVVHADPRVRLLPADGRNHLALTDATYDVIISQPSNPWIAGVANLFTREFFELVDRRLAAGGRFGMWLQGYGTSLENFRTVVRTVAERFPFITLWELSRNDYALIVAREPFVLTREQLEQTLRQPPVRTDLARVGYGRLHHLLARFVAASPATQTWAGPGPIHTDDNALLEFSAPRQLYAGQDLQIFDSLEPLQVSPLGTIVRVGDSPADAELKLRVEAAIAARAARFVAVRKMRSGGAPLDRVRAGLAILESCPGDIEAWMDARNTAGEITRRQPAVARLPETQALFEALQHARGPLLPDRRGVTLDEFIALLNRAAEEAEKRGASAAAESYRAEAREFAPSP